jgi:sugar lactone lactonase YvrE
VTERELRRALRERPVPGEGDAGERTLRVLRAAHGARPATPPRRRLVRPAAAIALALAVLATAMTPAGADVREWLGDRLDPPPSPTLSRLPAAGRLLVSSAAGSWVVDRDGGLRRLGDYTSAGWSPNGLFVAATSGRRLYAAEPGGAVRWSIVRPGAVSHPSWSGGEGFRVAFLEGRDLRVVAGDGVGDRLLARGVAPVTPAWRPGSGHVLTYATRTGRIVTRDVDAGRVLWSARASEPTLALRWTDEGGRLVALGPDRLATYTRDGASSEGAGLPGRDRTRALAVHPSGRKAAVAGEAGGVLVVPLGGPGRARRLFDGAGTFSGLAWSPDGRWLLAAWRDAGQWVFIRSGGGRGRPFARRVVTFSRIAEQLDPSGSVPASFPRIEGWCC